MIWAVVGGSLAACIGAIGLYLKGRVDGALLGRSRDAKADLDKLAVEKEMTKAEIEGPKNDAQLELDLRKGA